MTKRTAVSIDYVKGDYVIRIDSDDLNGLRWMLGQQIERERSSLNFFELRGKEDKAFHEQAKETRRNLKRHQRFVDELEAAVGKIDYGHGT